MRILVKGYAGVRERTVLLSFNHREMIPMEIACRLNKLGVESRVGCHCATLAHHFYGLTPPASCRVSFYIYSDQKDVARAVRALKRTCNKV